MRLLGGLGLLAPVSLVAAWLAFPDVIDAWTGEGTRSVLAALVAGSMGVSLTAGFVFLYVRLRLRKFIRAAEQLAAGDLDVSIAAHPTGRGLEGRLGRAIGS